MILDESFINLNEIAATYKRESKTKKLVKENIIFPDKYRTITETLYVVQLKNGNELYASLEAYNELLNVLKERENLS